MIIGLMYAEKSNEKRCFINCVIYSKALFHQSAVNSKPIKVLSAVNQVKFISLYRGDNVGIPRGALSRNHNTLRQEACARTIKEIAFAEAAPSDKLF
ncbi:MAG: hypothetical protein PUK72_08940 [Oscillospiraceae bacterium]|nr:hypothetical protein [Oscillospiraceae bacterium]